VKPPRRWLRCLAWAAVPTALLLGVCYLGRATLLPPVARFLDVSEPPRKVDYVLVLGGGTDTRPFVAAALVKAGWSRQVLLSTVRLSPEAEQGFVLSEQETTIRVLKARGVPADAIRSLPGECSNTADEAAALGRFLDAEPAVHVMIVTHTYHTRRARSIFRAALGARAERVHFVAAPTDGYSADDWWQSEEGFGCYVNEYVKLLTFKFRS
jgi:uncharacterized SAM-binding protein YcdF (DUF218 family)